MKLNPGVYRLEDGTLARLSLTPTGYQVTTADGTTFITDTSEVR